jgi:hypothetical protein
MNLNDTVFHKVYGEGKIIQLKSLATVGVLFNDKAKTRSGDGYVTCGNGELSLTPSVKGPLVVNLFAGPGAGKSTLASGLFYKLKMNGVNAELVTEYAKDKTWEGASKCIFDNQIYIFGKQHHRQFRLLEGVDVIVTDSPLLLSIYYADFKDRELKNSFNDVVVKAFNQFNNISYFINRNKPYNPKGRSQTFAEAEDIDRSVWGIMIKYIGTPVVIQGDEEGLNTMLGHVIMKHDNLKQQGLL